MNAILPRVGTTALCCCLIAASLEAQVLRYQDELRGNVAMTGNTLGLSKQPGANGPGLEGSIGTFLTENAASVDDVPPNPANPWPGGTTPLWPFNGSSGNLTLSSTAGVVYAELVWGGSTAYVDDVAAFLNGAVTLAGPQGGTVAVPPDPATSVTLATSSTIGFYPVNYYLRSADVTAFVAVQGAGTYAARGVPATQNEAVNSFNAAGWALFVVYEDFAEPYRYVALATEGRFVEEGSDADTVFGGLFTASSGAVSGRLLVAALEGDANLDGDQLWIRPGNGAFVPLSGPGNPTNNFFASQVNDVLGMRDTTGSFGGVNHDPNNAINVLGARQGWDLTGVALQSASGHLTNGQSSATIRSTTTGDATILMATALAVEQPRTPAWRVRSTAGRTLEPVRRDLP